MNKELIKDYARLLARKGINVEKGEEVWINAQLDQPEFVRMVVEECYKAGAKKVVVHWLDDKTTKLSYKYMTASNLGKVPNYRVAEYKYMIKHTPSVLHIVSDDPNAFKGISQRKMVVSRMKSMKVIKPLRDQIESRYKWCIGAVPGIEWARQVFPKLKDDEAVEKLWEAILTCSRVDGNDPCENWTKHNEFLAGQCKKLHDLKLQYLEYKAGNGTDFKVELIKGINWGAGLERTDKGLEFNPNIPSEEVFTTPKAGSVDGIVYSSKPLSYNGFLIEDFFVKFKDGKVIEVGAKKNQKVLEDMISMDEGSKMLGEVALVPFNSPIRNSGVLFYETLFDENAACHLALGMGFKELLPGGANMSNEEAHSKGINDSMIHVDFMIGTSDLSIVGVGEDGKRTQIFKNGNWAI